MAESFNKNKRAVFSKDAQKRFLERIKKNLHVNWKALARQIGVSEKTLSDWRREKLTMPLGTVRALARRAHIPFPQHIEIRDNFWSTTKAAKIGGNATFKKYGRVGGSPEHRKKQWRAWWKREGKRKPHSILQRLPIRKPSRSPLLAEFVGIALGDGGITNRQVTITLNRESDKGYVTFVVALIQKLFGLRASLYNNIKYSAVNIVVSRTELVGFCTKILGLKRGNKVKQKVNIPRWIMRRKKLQIACVRGLIDTDGCVIIHRYKVRNKYYIYKKLAFTSHSDPLRQSVYKILKTQGLHPRMAQRKDVRLDSKKDLHSYFSTFKSHNPKHLERYKS